MIRLKFLNIKIILQFLNIKYFFNNVHNDPVDIIKVIKVKNKINILDPVDHEENNEEI